MGVKTQHEEEKNLQKRALLTAADLKYARKLSENEANVRNRALKLLKDYLAIRSKTIPWIEDNLQILWKGLFYSMWMSDKPLIQEECAENISKLIHSFWTLQEKFLFFKSGLTILQNEWIGVDQHRMDKFLMFIRRLLRQALFVLKERNFKKKYNELFSQVLQSTVLNVDKVAPIGLILHFTEIFLEEVAKVNDGNVAFKTRAIDLLRPFVVKLAYSTDSREIQWINKFVFVYLIKQHDLGLEYKEKYNVWQSMGFPGTIDQIQKVTESGSDEDQHSDEEADKKLGQLPKGAKPLDPRAGRVDVELPQILFEEKRLAEELLSFTGDKRTSTTSRNVLVSQAKNFQMLAQGTYPLGIKSVQSKKHKNLKEVDTDVKKAAKRLIKFENNLLGKHQKRRNSDNENKIPNKRQKLDDFEGIETINLSKKEKKILKSLVKQQHIQSNQKEKMDISSAEKEKQEIDREENNLNRMDFKNKKSGKSISQRQATKTKSNDGRDKIVAKESDTMKVISREKEPAQTSVSSTEEFVDPSEVPTTLTDDADLVCFFRRNCGVWFVTESPDLCLPRGQASEGVESLNLRPTHTSTTADELLPTISGIDSSNKRLKKSNTLIQSKLKQTLNITGEIVDGSSYVNNATCNSPQQKNIFKEIEKTSSEITSRTSSPGVNSSFFKNNKGKSEIKFHRSSSSNTPKKVRINTKLNVSQEIYEHISQVFSSPQIPFDKHKKPGKPLLKTPVKASPINPFYKLKF